MGPACGPPYRPRSVLFSVGGLVSMWEKADNAKTGKGEIWDLEDYGCFGYSGVRAVLMIPGFCCQWDFGVSLD